MKKLSFIVLSFLLLQFIYAQKSQIIYDDFGHVPQKSDLAPLSENQTQQLESNEWTALGPFGGDVIDVAMDPTNPDRGFAAAGIPYMRIGQDNNWEVVENLLAMSPSGIHCFEANSNGTVIAGGNYSYGKVYISNDGGETWSQSFFGNNAGVLSISIDPSDPATIYVTTNGILGSTQSLIVSKSTDSGETWTVLDLTAAMPGGFGCVDMAVDPNDSDVLFAIGSEGISNGTVAKSVDGGATWQTAMGNLPSGKPLNAVTIANGAVYVCGGQLFGGNVMGVYKSLDMGTTWTAISSTFPNKVANDLLINPDDPDNMYVATEGDGIYFTTDGGANWEFNTGGAGDNGSARKVIFHPMDNETIIAGYLSLGVCYSNDGGENWITATEGISALELNDIEIDPNNANIALASFEAENSGGCYIFSGEEWSLVESLPATRFSAVDIGYDGTMYAWSNGPTTVAAEGVYKSADGGQTWENMGPNLGSVFETQIWDIEISELDQNLIYIGGNNFGVAGWASMLYKSTDGGENWDNVFSGPDNDAIRFVHLVPGTDDMDMYAAYKSETAGGFLKSIDGGTNWLPVNDGLPAGVKWCGAIVSDPLDGNILYGGVGGYGGVAGTIYKSEDAGSNWSSMGVSLGNYCKVTDFMVSPQNNMVVYAATTLNGVYMTSDASNWQPANAGLPATNITGFSRVFDSGFESFVFCASTATNSAFFTDVYNPTGTGINPSNNQEFALYSNPASDYIYLTSGNKSTRIKDVKIVDLTGKTIIHLTKMNQEPNCKINLESISTGVYTIMIITDKGTNSQKLVIK